MSVTVFIIVLTLWESKKHSKSRFFVFIHLIKKGVRNASSSILCRYFKDEKYIDGLMAAGMSETFVYLGHK